MGKRTLVLIPGECEEIILALDNDEKRGKLFKAIFGYAFSGIEPTDFTGSLKAAFIAMKLIIDNTNKEWF